MEGIRCLTLRGHGLQNFLNTQLVKIFNDGRDIRPTCTPIHNSLVLLCSHCLAYAAFQMPQEQHTFRKIIHVDMDAFYASVEQRDNPELKGKAVIVGGLPDRRGVVSTASYEARAFGVHSAMPSRTAQRLCPHGIFIFPRHQVYQEVSLKVREIFHRYTDLIEPLSLDEAYLDVTTDKLQIRSAIDIAKQIKETIKHELELTASAGVSINKFVAKIASGMNKPDGLTFIGPSSVQAFMEKLPVEKFHGVGKITAEKMKKMGVEKGADLKALSQADLVRHFGKIGNFYYQIVRGVDDREVQPNRETKSVSAEDTFFDDVTDTDKIVAEIERLSAIVSKRLKSKNLKGRTIILKIKYSDFKQISRNLSVPAPVEDAEIIAEKASQLFFGLPTKEKPVRLVGVGISNFGADTKSHERGNFDQLELFT